MAGIEGGPARRCLFKEETPETSTKLESTRPSDTKVTSFSLVSPAGASNTSHITADHGESDAGSQGLKRTPTIICGVPNYYDETYRCLARGRHSPTRGETHTSARIRGPSLDSGPLTLSLSTLHCTILYPLNQGISESFELSLQFLACRS